MKVLVYLPEEKLAPKGGPFAVGYYYYEEMKRREIIFWSSLTLMHIMKMFIRKVVL